MLIMFVLRTFVKLMTITFPNAGRNRRKPKEMLKQKEAEKKFLERIGKFIDLVISDNKLTIVPLKSLDEFKQEGDTMHHCVFANGYWKRSDCLILSARIGEKRIETI